MLYTFNFNNFNFNNFNNMNKQKFEGKINGELFTDVKEFNKKAAELMKAGQNYNISYNWSSENVEEPESKKCECGNNCECGGNLTSEELGYIIPRYVRGSVKEVYNDYIEELMATIVDDLDARFDNFTEVVNCGCKRKALVKRLKDAKLATRIESDDLEKRFGELIDRKRELESELQNLENEVSLLTAERQICNKVEQYYEDIQDEIVKYNEGTAQPTATAQIKEKHPQVEQDFEIKDALNMLGVDTSKISNEDINKLQKITDTLAEQLTKYLNGQCF